VIVSHASLILLARFDVTEVQHHLPESTVFMGIPTFYTRLLGDPDLTPARCRSVRLFTSGSAPLPASVHDEFAARTGHAIVERYGMTETSIITSNPLGGERAGTVGRPLPGVELRVVDADDDAGRPTGSIEVRGPNVFGGYWRRPDATAAEFTPDGYFKTGDLGHLDPDGYLTIVGRSRDVIISGGFNVYPKEVEDALSTLTGVEESAVVGLPDDDLGERVVAVIVARPGAQVDGQAVRTAARQTLAAYKVPKQVHVVDALPRNAMGKVEKARIREDLNGAQLA
jgi:malonyl-CoA/methylmalonyl-CoA synthetase